MPKKKLDPIPIPFGTVTCNSEKGFIQGLPEINMTVEVWEKHPEELRTVGLLTGVFTLNEEPIEEELPEEE